MINIIYDCWFLKPATIESQRRIHGKTDYGWLQNPIFTTNPGWWLSPINSGMFNTYQPISWCRMSKNHPPIDSSQTSVVEVRKRPNV